MNEQHQFDDAVVEMFRCEDCGHMVPVSNRGIHQARGCQARKRPARASSPPPVATQTNLGNNYTPMQEDRDNAVHPSAPPASWDTDPSTPPPRAASLPTAMTPISIPDDDDDSKPPAANFRRRSSGVLESGDFVDLVNDENTEQQDGNKTPKNQWSCPRCTLYNSNTRERCEACNARRPDHVRPADPTVREQLIANDDYASTPNGSPAMYMSGGALIGGLVGAASAAYRGRTVASGALEGAMSGVVGGAVLQEVFRDSPQRRQQRQPQQQSFARAPASGAPQRMMMRRRVGPHGGMMVTSYSSGARGGGAAMNDPMVEHMMQALLSGGMMPAGGRNIDGMSYEQLLQTFGDGMENMGAEEGEIRSLPVSVVDDPSRLPADARQCMVCLEEFEAHEKRKTLPCLHGFHEHCIDKWLRTNAACPICKHRIH